MFIHAWILQMTLVLYFQKILLTGTLREIVGLSEDTPGTVSIED